MCAAIRRFLLIYKNKNTPGPTPDYCNCNICKACWESFVELNLFGNAIVLLKEEKKFRTYKMNMLKRYNQFVYNETQM